VSLKLVGCMSSLGFWSFEVVRFQSCWFGRCGFLEFWIFEGLGCWGVEVLECCSLAVLELWSLGLGVLEFWSFWGFGVLKKQSTASWLYVKPGGLEVWHGVGSWSFGIVVLWSFGVLEFGSLGVLFFWSLGFWSSDA